MTSVRSLRAHGRIETVARVRVVDSWRGPTSGTISVRTPGGFLGSRRLVVAGSAELARGENVLLFLYRDGGAWRPVGMFQGVWRPDPDDPERWLPSSGGGASLLKPVRGKAAVEHGERTLEQLLGGLEVAR